MLLYKIYYWSVCRGIIYVSNISFTVYFFLYIKEDT